MISKEVFCHYLVSKSCDDAHWEIFETTNLVLVKIKTVEDFEPGVVKQLLSKAKNDLIASFYVGCSKQISSWHAADRAKLLALMSEAEIFLPTIRSSIYDLKTLSFKISTFQRAFLKHIEDHCFRSCQN